MVSAFLYGRNHGYGPGGGTAFTDLYRHKGDTYAVLLGLGEVLGGMLEAGYSVKLKGVGTFYLTGRAEGQGVDTPEEVSGQQFSKLQVRFIPEYRRMQNGQVAERTLVPDKVEWVEMELAK